MFSHHDKKVPLVYVNIVLLLAEKSVRQNAKDELLAQAMLVQAHIKKTLILHHTMSIYMGEKKEL